MTISDAYELATNAEFKQLSNFATPPRAGKVTAIEASGQVRVETDDPDGGDVLAWPLNGFTYAVGDVVYIAFASNSPDTALVIGSKAPAPGFGAGLLATLKSYLDTLYVALTGSQTIAGEKSFTDAVDIGNYGALAGSTLEARMTVAGNADAITGIHAYNASAGAAAEFRHLVYDNVKSSYITFSMASTGNVGMIFGLARNTLAVLFTAGGTYLRHLAIGTFHASDIIFGTNNVERERITSGGDHGFGTASPQGKLHAHDGTGGFIFVTKTGLVNAAQTLIPNGTGDVTKGIMGFFVCDSGGAVMSTFQLTPGANVDVAVGGFTLRLALSAGGALTAIRQSGAGTATLAVAAVWM